MPLVRLVPCVFAKEAADTSPILPATCDLYDEALSCTLEPCRVMKIGTMGLFQ